MSMSGEIPPRKTSEEFNPYAPPEASLEAEPVELMVIGDLAETEAVRKAHIRHEASIKSIGWLHFLGVPLCFLMAVGAVAALFQVGRGLGAVMIASAVLYLVLGGLHLALGLGLVRLQTWARWTDVVLTALLLSVYGIGAMFLIVARAEPSQLISISFGSAIFGYILYLLLSTKATTIFSAEYKAVIDQTPHIRYRTSSVVKIFLVALVAVIVLAVVGGVLVGLSR